MKKSICLLALIVLVSGCASSGIVKISPDTYIISKESWGFTTSGIKAKVFKQANAFAASQGKVAIPLTTSERELSFGKVPKFELQFRVVDKDDPEAKRTHLIKNADVTIKRDDAVKADIDVTVEEENNGRSDLYTELMKLEDLRKNKLLTEEEFQSQKKLLLERQK